MFILNSSGTDPFFNLALEEVLLKKRNEEFIIFGRNSRSVVAGKHQCINREINTQFVSGNNIPVIRRITGGGTVYHDSGNLTFAFIRNCEQGRQIDFPRHLRPVIGFLESLGIAAELKGSDILVNSMKISGNAEHIYHNRVLHHGTILFDADLGSLRSSLRKDSSGYNTRAVPSNPSPVMNLSNKITQFRSIAEFQEAMSDFFKRKYKDSQPYVASGDEMKEASELAETKYKTWEWTYAYGPEYELSRNFQYMGSDCHFRIHVKNGIIEDCLIEGNSEIERFAPVITGQRHMPADMSKALLNLQICDLDVYNFF